MLLAIVVLATLSDPNVYGGFAFQDGGYSLKLTVYTEAPLSQPRPIRLDLDGIAVNGRRVQVRLEPKPGSDLTMRKGAEKHEVEYRMVPSPPPGWIECEAKFAIGGGRPFRTSVATYVPPDRANDVELKRARARYVGKPVWVYGGSAYTARSGERYDYFTGLRPLRVLDVKREFPPTKRQDYEVYPPLLMTFAPIPKGEFGMRDEQRVFLEQPLKASEHPPIFTFAQTSLILSEMVSLTPPPAKWRSKPGRVETAMREFDLDFTKAKREMLWVLGRPSVDKPWQSVFARNAWPYPVAAPFTYVMKFREGRLVGKEMEGDLP